MHQYENDETVDEVLLWEMIKLQIRDTSIKYSKAIRRDNEIKGISVGNVECKISQFADDSTMILDGSQVSLERSFALLDSFGQLSGLRVNCEKLKFFG